MKARVLFVMALLAAIPAWAQVEPSATGGSATTDDTEEMMTPPPVSGESFPTEVGSEEQSNFIKGTFVFNTSYVDNLYAGSPNTVSEKIYTVLPTLSYDQAFPRQHVSLIYRPGFTFYQPSSALNEVDQNVDAEYKVRLSPHINLNANDTFQKSSTAYGLEDSAAGGAVSGSTQSLTPGIVAPFAERLTNSASAEFSYQFSPVGMVGGSGSLMRLSFPNVTQSTGLYDSNERGGGAFYNRRLSASQYLGANYQYSWDVAQPNNANSETQTHSINGFYSVYPRPDLSISVSGGVQRYSFMQAPLPESGGWGPLVTTSIGWQRPHTNLAARYSRQSTSGGGLLGVFQSNSVSVTARWRLSPAWSAGASGNYANNKSITPLASKSVQDGHSISAQGTLGYAIDASLHLNLEYDRLHQDYSGIPSIADNPNSDRVMISFEWEFSKPLGR
jgi:hypothetical protein